MLATGLTLTAGAAAAFAEPGSDATTVDGSSNHAVTAAGNQPNPSGPEDKGQLSSHVALATKPDETTTGTTGIHRNLAVAATGTPSLTSGGDPSNEPTSNAEPSSAAPAPAVVTAVTVEPQSTGDPPAPTESAVALATESSTPATQSNNSPPVTPDQSVPMFETVSPTVTAAPTTAVEPLATPVSQDVPVATDVEPTPPPPVDVSAPVVSEVPVALPMTMGTRNRPGPNALTPMQILRLVTSGSWFASVGAAVAVPSRESVMALTSDTPSLSFGTTTAPARTSAIASSANVTSPAGAVLPESLRVFLHSYGQLVVAASLSAVAAAALPGLLGMIVPALAGIRIGYRQAKAARTVRASGLARFAGSGPIGIVRSGLVVALASRRPRGLGLDAVDPSERVA